MTLEVAIIFVPVSIVPEVKNTTEGNDEKAEDAWKIGAVPSNTIIGAKLLPGSGRDVEDAISVPFSIVVNPA